MTNYQIITDKEKFNEFLNWLPPTEVSEQFYCSLLARSKYTRDIEGLNIGTFHSDRHQCARFVVPASRLLTKVQQLECPVGSYRVKGIEVPQEALALYLCPNPRSHLKASQRLLVRLAEAIANGEPNLDVIQESLSATHKSIGRKFFVDFDFDGVDMVETCKEIRKHINQDAVDVLETRGGFHVLVRLDRIESTYSKTWHRGLSSITGADAVGDMMIPCPGTYQGGFTPVMRPLSKI